MEEQSVTLKKAITEEQYVTFETAKLLRNVGFNIPCFAFWCFDPERNETCRVRTDVKTNHNVDDSQQYFYSCPTQALSAKWLREKHKLHIYSYYVYETEAFGYVIQDIADIDDYGSRISDNTYTNFELAMEMGLQEAIGIILREK